MEREMQVIDDNLRLNGVYEAREWQAAFDSLSEWVSIHDKDFKIVRANKSMAEALHTSPKALVGQYCYNVICHAAKPCLGCPKNLVQQTGTHHSSRVFLPRLGFFSDVSIWPLLDPDGEVDRTIHVIRDAALYSNLDIDPTQGGLWFRKLANSLPYMAFELDNLGNLIFANPALMAVTGYKPEEFGASLNAKQMVDGGDMEKLQKDILMRILGVHAGKPEYTIITKAGKRIPVEVFASPILDAAKKPIGLRGIAFDITERRHSEETVLQNALELDRVFNTAAGAMCIINKDFSIRRMNNEFAATFGLDASKSVGRKCNEILRHICCDRMQCPLGMVLNGANRIEQETEADTSTGEKCSFHLTVVPYCDSNGEVLGMVSNFRNITDMKLVQKQLQQASILASLGEMTAGIAHEVNNPLSSILLYSELLMAGDVPPKMRKDLKLIHDEAERAARTMSELLNYARGIETAVRKVNLNNLVKKVLEVRSYQHGVKNIRVLLKLSRKPLYTRGDANQLTQVVMNLVLNAEDSLSEKKGGKITITTEVGSKWGRLIVKDTGRGINKENLQKIFFPFFTTKKNTQRSGLGLSVCYGIVTRHHGFIRAENNPGGGARFVVELPLVQPKHRRVKPAKMSLEKNHEPA